MLKSRNKVGAVITIVLVAAAWPAAEYWQTKKHESFREEAWAHFKNKCETASGEKIYKTFSGVKSVLVLKPLPPATEKDLHNQFWYGDPYSAPAHSQRGVAEASALTGTIKFTKEFGGAQRGFDFIEIKYEENNLTRYVRISPLAERPYRLVADIQAPASRFSVSWEDISTPEDRKYWIAGSKLQITDLSNGNLVAQRVGYFIESGFGSDAGGRRPWLASRGPGTTCPPIQNGSYEDRWFVLKALIPGDEAAAHGK